MKKIKLRELAGLISGQLIGDGDIEVNEIRDITEAGIGCVSFIVHPKFAAYLENTKASCAIVPQGIEKAACPIIRVKNPAIAFIKVVETLMPDRIPHPKGINKLAVIAKSAKIGKNVAIGPYAVISSSATIGDRSIIYPFSYIGDSTEIGDDCIIYPNVSIRENIKIGSRVIIHSGSVVGSDGFGYDNTTGVHLKIPQVGGVIIEDDVEIGACVTIDRAKFSNTKIGKGTKIDNLVQIAHNVIIGENCIIVAQCGISGSSTLGKNVMMGGQAGLVDHITLGDNVMVAAQAGLTKSVPANTIMFGTPARPMRFEKKLVALIDKLPEIYERLKKLENQAKVTG
jgi:UDP-3-O-[3-hydroxymyristoyl] glucosamine N-acyltransferase